MEDITRAIDADKLLVKQAVSGNNLAFKKIVELHQQRIYATVLSMLGNTPEVDDVTQEVFIRFFKSMAQFKAESKLSTYLTRIAINLSLNELKRRKNQWRILPLFEKKEAREQQKVIDLEEKGNLSNRFDNRQAIDAALKELAPPFKAVVVLRLIEGFSVKETAELLNLPQGTIASRLSRAQKQMIAFLSKKDV